MFQEYPKILIIDGVGVIVLSREEEDKLTPEKEPVKRSYTKKK